jgi:hypothetical protein
MKNGRQSAPRSAERRCVINVTDVDFDAQLAEICDSGLAMNPGNRFVPGLDDCVDQVASEES